MQHTPGPWSYRSQPHDDWGIVRAGRYIICQARNPASDTAYESRARREHFDPYEGNARLIAAAPDHALIGWAMCVGAARWEPFGDMRGEFCMNGIRHATRLDEFGVPEMTASMRASILKAKGPPVDQSPPG